MKDFVIKTAIVGLMLNLTIVFAFRVGVSWQETAKVREIKAYELVVKELNHHESYNLDEEAIRIVAINKVLNGG